MAFICSSAVERMLEWPPLIHPISTNGIWRKKPRRIAQEIKSTDGMMYGLTEDETRIVEG